MSMLHPGDPFPAFTINLPGGGSLPPSDRPAGNVGAVVFCRGLVVPVPKRPVAPFSSGRLDSLASVGAKAAGLSVGDKATAPDLIAKHGLQVRVGHKGRARAIARYMTR